MSGDMLARGLAIKGAASYQDSPRSIYGTEYLSAFHKKIMAGSATICVFSGDSTTAGNSADPGFFLSDLVLENSNKRGLYNFTTVNRGQSGMNTLDWVNTYLAGDIAANPDVLILRWGLNDAGTNGFNSFVSSLRSGLTTLRASKPLVTTSVILMTPNSTNDTPNKRDAKWHQAINGVIKQAARDFNCVFIDTYAIWKDSINAADWMDNPYADGRHIHPLDVMNIWITSVICDVLFPRVLRDKYNNNIVTNPPGAFVIKAATDTPSTYSKGVSIYRAITGFPYNGMVTTFYQNDEILLQINSGYDTSLSEYSFRVGYKTSNLWGAWSTVKGTTKIIPALLNGWVNYDVGTEGVGYAVDSNKVTLQGVIKSGTSIPGTVLFNLPAPYRPPLITYRTGYSAGKVVSIGIQTNGNVTIGDSNVSATDLNLAGVSFYYV